MKHPLLLFFLLAAFSWQSANAQLLTLVLHHTDGQITKIELSEKPRIKFGSETMKIQSATLNLEYDRKDVERFTFEGDNTGVGNMKGETVYRIENDRIVFSEVTSVDRINVCNVSGTTIPVRITMDGTNAILPLSALPSDVCIVTINGKSFKLAPAGSR